MSELPNPLEPAVVPDEVPAPDELPPPEGPPAPVDALPDEVPPPERLPVPEVLATPDGHAEPSPMEPEPSAMEPEPSPTEPEPEPAATSAPEPVPAAEPATVPMPVEPEPAATSAPEPVPAAEPAAEPATAPILVETPVIPPVQPAPEPEALVPLTEIAPAITAASLSRRLFLGFGLAVAGGLAGAAAIARLFPVFAESAPPPIVPTYDPASKAWTFVVDTESCIGCGLCVAACKEENHITEEPQFTRTWVERHTRTVDGELIVDCPDGGVHGYPPGSLPEAAEGKTITASYFEPRLCMQCENSPCTTVCPVGATYRTEDGVILVDARRCIGCGYCVVACPYGARYLTPAGDRNPYDMPGIADKCTWCYHRISQGRLPACVEVCPVGARKFGDVSDPDSEIATIVRERRPQMLHPEYGTRPRVLYLGPSTQEA